jgi:hypothetical protein
MRDEFSAKHKQTLAQRVGFLCSNPACRALTIGPQQASEGAVNLGVASHITAASPGGPRFDAQVSADERCALSNGIWLCQVCAKLVDSGDARFTRDLLQAWKTVAEDHAAVALGRFTPPGKETREQVLLRGIGPWIGKTVTLAQMSTGPGVRTAGPIRGVAEVHVVACNEFFVTVGIGGNSQRSISLANISINFDDARQRLQIQERYE